MKCTGAAAVGRAGAGGGLTGPETELGMGGTRGGIGADGRKKSDRSWLRGRGAVLGLRRWAGGCPGDNRRVVARAGSKTLPVETVSTGGKPQRAESWTWRLAQRRD